MHLLTILLAILATFSVLLMFERLAVPPRKQSRWSRPLRAGAAVIVYRIQEALIIPARAWQRFRYRHHRTQCAANIAEGTHEHSVTKLTDAAITARHLLFKQGSDDDHIAVAGATDIPLGTVPDEADAAEVHVELKLLGRGSTTKMVASEAIGAGVNVFAAASGKVATTGTVFVGVSVTAAGADDDVLEVNCTGPAPFAGAKTSSVAVDADELAIPITHRVAVKTTGADAEALTLADGIPGQRLNIILDTDGGGNGTLTPTTSTGWATIVFADAGDIVDLEYVDDTVGWIITGSAGVAAPPVITV